MPPLTNKVLGWILLQQGFVVKSRLHKVGITNSTCASCGKDETVEHVFWNCQTARVFGHGFTLNFTLLLLHSHGWSPTWVTLGWSRTVVNYFGIQFSWLQLAFSGNMVVNLLSMRSLISLL